MRATAALFRRARSKHALTTKQVGSNYYKGNRTGRMGEHTKYGGYRVDYNLVRSYVVPKGLKDFKLTPFVTRKLIVQPTDDEFAKLPTGESYLALWKKTDGQN